MNFIDGQWVPPLSNEFVAVESPATGLPIAEIADSGADDARTAVRAARKAFDEGPWPRMTPAERRDVIQKLVAVLSERSEELVELAILDTGATHRVATAMQVGAAIQRIQLHAAEQAHLLAAEDYGVVEAPFGHSEGQRVPLGVVASFTPFNFPLLIAANKIAAAAMGNTMVWKPAPTGSLLICELIRAMHDAGFPAGSVNLVLGDDSPGRVLSADPGVDAVTFTGSTAVGRAVMAAAAPTLKRVTLELGGKAPVVVLDDADLDFALRGALITAFLHSGQISACGTRLLVPRKRFDEACDKLCELVPQFRIGDPRSPETDIGPVISAAQLARMRELMDSALDDGAKILASGTIPDDLDDGGHYFAPTVLLDVTPGMRVWREEVFGPVLTVTQYDDDEDAIRLANDSDYGLTATVWGTDLMRARAIASRIDCGSVFINDWGGGSPDAPFGGFKQSGLGMEMGPYGALEFTKIRHVFTAFDTRLDRRPFPLACAQWANPSQ